MEAFYFGPNERQLFGIYHPPTSHAQRNTAVVLCHPLGQEYIRSHRAFLQLAIRLSSAGFHTLRFDFYGCGDSAGQCQEGTLSGWLDDIRIAIDELGGGCGAPYMCLIGLRLGASLSILAGAEFQGLKCMILWDPLISGKCYLEELKERHEDWLRGSFARLRPGTAAGMPVERLGFALGDALLSECQALDLLRVTRKPADKIFLLESSPRPSAGPLAEHLQSLGAEVQHTHIPAPPAWTKVQQGQADDFGDGLVPTELLDQIVTWISTSDS